MIAIANQRTRVTSVNVSMDFDEDIQTLLSCAEIVCNVPAHGRGVNRSTIVEHLVHREAMKVKSKGTRR